MGAPSSFFLHREEEKLIVSMHTLSRNVFLQQKGREPFQKSSLMSLVAPFTMRGNLRLYLNKTRLIFGVILGYGTYDL